MVWLQSGPVVHMYVLDHCDTLYETQSVKTQVLPVGLAFSNNSRHMLDPFNSAISHLLGTPKYNEIAANNFRSGTGCENKQNSDDQAISLHNMLGVFIVYGALALASLVHTSIQQARQNGSGATNDNSDDTKHKTEMFADHTHVELTNIFGLANSSNVPHTGVRPMEDVCIDASAVVGSTEHMSSNKKFEAIALQLQEQVQQLITLQQTSKAPN